MDKTSQTLNYAIGSIKGNTLNMYLCGSGVLSLLRFVLGLIETGTTKGAAMVTFDFYVATFTPFPINEFLTAGGIVDLGVSVAIAVLLGTFISSKNYFQSI